MRCKKSENGGEPASPAESGIDGSLNGVESPFSDTEAPHGAADGPGEAEKPKVEQLEAELERVNRRTRLHRIVKNTLYTLIVVASCAVLVAILFLPVLRIHGSSMTPTFHEGEIVVSVKNDDVKPDYPDYIVTSGAKEGATSIGEVTGTYYSDPGTSQIENDKYFNDRPADDGKVITDKSVVYGDDDYGVFDNYDPNTFGVELSALGQEYSIA